MFDIGWSEMLVIACLAIVVIGPKQLPAALRTVGYWIGRAKRMANEFQGHVDEMVAQAELDEVRQEVNSISNFDINEELNKSIELDGRSKVNNAENVEQIPASAEAEEMTGLESEGMDPTRYAPDGYQMPPSNSIVPPPEDESEEAPSADDGPKGIQVPVVEEEALDVDHDDDEDEFVDEELAKQEKAGP
jgi:sec-independent protein translocase protein TatB